MMTERIVFVCTGNTCRSPMAEVFFRKLGGEDRLGLLAISAGTFTEDGIPASSNAVRAAYELGAEISAHRSHRLTTQMVEDAKHIVCMTMAHLERVKVEFPEVAPKLHTLSETDIQDPFGGNLECYQKAAKQIYDAVEELILRLENHT